MQIDGKRGHGRPRKTWSECVREDLDAFKLKPSDAQDRVGWRSSVKNSRLEPTPLCGSASLSKARPTRGMCRVGCPVPVTVFLPRILPCSFIPSVKKLVQQMEIIIINYILRAYSFTFTHFDVFRINRFSNLVLRPCPMPYSRELI